MATIILSLFGVSLLLYAFYPELKYYYRRSRLIPSNGEFDAETARKLTDLSIRYLSERQCVIWGHLLYKKTVISIIANGVLLLICIILALSCPYELPFLLSFALDSYMWVYSSCIVLRYCLRHFRIPFLLSLAIALFLPVCIYGLLYFYLYNYSHFKI